MPESNNSTHFKNVVLNMTKDAVTTLEEMREECDRSPLLREKFHLLHHYLTYLQRLFEGEA
jgi:hypothetical protein